MRGLLEQAGRERTEVARITDEELAVLTDDAPRPAARPWYDALPEQDRTTARTVALRSLAARGLVVPRPLPDGEVQVSVPLALQAVLVLPRRARTALLVERRTADATVFHVVHVLPDGCALDEHVSSGGLHTLTVGPLEPAVHAVVDVLDPAGTALLDGSEEDVPAGGPGDVQVSSVLVAASPGTERRASVHVGADRVLWVVAGDVPGTYRGHQVSRRGLVDAVLQLLH